MTLAIISISTAVNVTYSETKKRKTYAYCVCLTLPRISITLVLRDFTVDNILSLIDTHSVVVHLLTSLLRHTLAFQCRHNIDL